MGVIQQSLFTTIAESYVSKEKQSNIFIIFSNKINSNYSAKFSLDLVIKEKKNFKSQNIKRIIMSNTCPFSFLKYISTIISQDCFKMSTYFHVSWSLFYHYFWFRCLYLELRIHICVYKNYILKTQIFRMEDYAISQLLTYICYHFPVAKKKNTFKFLSF